MSEEAFLLKYFTYDMYKNKCLGPWILLNMELAVTNFTLILLYICL